MTAPVFPTAAARAGMYESFYLRAVSPREPVGVWIRYTVHKRPGHPPRGSLWFTLFDAARGRPFQHKLTTEELSVAPGGWIAVGGSTIGPAAAAGSCGEASWALRVHPRDGELRHLSPAWLYRTPLPRTKLTSPAPAAALEGTVEVAGRPALRLDGWPGMVGHNWGAEHAERWIWLHGTGFAEDPRAWLDVALGRVRLAGRLTPWVANGAVSVHGRRHRIGGLASSRELSVQEDAAGATLILAGPGGLRVRAEASVPEGSAAGWRYADPDGGEHDVVNCSVARLALDVQPPRSGGRVALLSGHGGAYELGMRERDHGVPIAPFPDG